MKNTYTLVYVIFFLYFCTRKEILSFNLLNICSMNVTINAVNFEMAEKLEQFIEKKMNRFERHLNADD